MEPHRVLQLISKIGPSCVLKKIHTWFHHERGFLCLLVGQDAPPLQLVVALRDSPVLQKSVSWTRCLATCWTIQLLSCYRHLRNTDQGIESNKLSAGDTPSFRDEYCRAQQHRLWYTISSSRVFIPLSNGSILVFLDSTATHTCVWWLTSGLSISIEQSVY